jgi:hypothetical protein
MKLPKVHLQYPKVGPKETIWIALNLPGKQVRYALEGKQLTFINLPGHTFAICATDSGKFSFTEVESGRRIALDDSEQKTIIRGLQRLEECLSMRGKGFLRRAINSCPKVKSLSEDAPRSQCDKHSDEPTEVMEVESIKF